MSWLILKFPKLRKIVSGSPKVIISNGKIDCHTLSELRLSVDDLMTALRGGDVFDLSEVQYAIVETTGSFSVMKKQTSDTPNRDEMKIKAQCSDPPMLVVSDGVMLENALDSLNMKRAAVDGILKKSGKKMEDVLIMTADKSGKVYIAWKSEGESETLEGYF